MRTPIAILLAVLASTVPAHPEDSAATARDYVGRWNVKILNSGDTFFSSWLRVVAADGGLQGTLVWKWGGVTRLEGVAVEGGELRFRRGGESFRARLVGDDLLGVAVMDKDAKFYFVGRRAPEMADVGGTWKVTPTADPYAAAGTLTLEQDGDKVTGKAADPEGNRFSISEVSLDTSHPVEEGYVLRLKAMPEGAQGAPPEVVCSIRGDSLRGTVTLTRPGADKVTVPIEGKRERAWGETLTLLADHGLEGWESRGQPGRKFGWEVKDGILRNSPPDDDIKSERKFKDFRLHLEYRVADGANSGVYLRGYYELQVLGSTDIGGSGNMAVYTRLVPKKNPLREPLAESWQDLDATLVGRWLTVSLNGEPIYQNEYLDGITGGAVDWLEGEAGPLLLQGDHGKVEFRNIRVTPAR